MTDTQELQVVDAVIIPSERVNWGNTAAKELMKVVKEVGLSRKFGGDRPHLYAEAWQILARFSGYHGIVDEPQEIYEDTPPRLIGFKAQAHVYDQDGREVSRATSYCMRDEPNWRNKPMFQLASMAQTRALSKAYRLELGWIAVLAGYSATPAEEMEGVIQVEAKQAQPDKYPSHRSVTDDLLERKNKATKWMAGKGKSVINCEGHLKRSFGDWTAEDLEELKRWAKSNFEEPPEPTEDAEFDD